LEVRQLLERFLALYGDMDMVAVSGMITTLRWQEDVAKLIRELQPHTFLIAGNGLATEFKAGLFNWIPELDAVAHSEGDLSIVKVVYDAVQIKKRGIEDALCSGKLAPYHMGEINGRHRFLYDGARPSDLDDVPFPAYHLLHEDIDGFPILETYLKNEIWGLAANNSSATPFTMKRSINTVSSRGCPYACHFCFRGATGERNYGVRSALNLAKEMSFYHEQYGVDFLGITDDNFMVKRDRIADLVPVLKPFIQKTGIRWGTHGRLDEAADLRPDGAGGKFNSPLRVDQMAEAGCVYIGFGAESASPNVLKAMNKGGFMLLNGTEKIDGFDLPRTMLDGYRNTVNAGIHGNCTWIAGYPTETLQDLKHSVAFILWQRNLLKDSASVNSRMFTATAYPGTDFFNDARVRARLTEGFGINFSDDGEPINDASLREYVLELDDADKILTDKKGKSVYYGAMTLDQFEKCRELIEAEQIERILDL